MAGNTAAFPLGVGHLPEQPGIPGSPCSVQGATWETGAVHLVSIRVVGYLQSLGTGDQPSGLPGTEGVAPGVWLSVLANYLGCSILRSSSDVSLSVLKPGTSQASWDELVTQG